jgi:DNA-binding Lrp family transcriptional regulator
MSTKFVKLKCQIGHEYGVAEELVQIPEVTEIYTMSGDFDLFVKVNLDDRSDLAQYVIKTLRVIDGVRDTDTLNTEPWFV